MLIVHALTASFTSGGRQKSTMGPLIKLFSNVSIASGVQFTLFQAALLALEVRACANSVRSSLHGTEEK